MKNMKWMLAAVVAMLAAVSCGTKKEEPKVLVLYYSQTGNTKAVAEEIAKRLGADIEALQAVNPYDGTYQETIERCLKEREEGTVPEVQTPKSDIAAYDVIFLGYPIWFGTYAPPVAALLRDADFSGKKIVPFCTFGSGGLDSSMKDLKVAQPQATVLPGYGVRAARMDAVPEEIDRFLKLNEFVKGEVEKLAEFPEQQAATEEEAAIFDAAVKGYPMINAKASTVASRALPNGVEYLFTAVDIPRADAPQGMPAREMKVYVLVKDGEDPVFTQVIR
jgi:flavodoxin